METKDYVTGSAITITLLLAIFGLVPSSIDTHFCEDRSMTYKCDSLSAYYGLDNGKCYNEDGNKLCRTGWVEIGVESTIEPVSPSSSGAKEVCNPNGCVTI